MLSFRTIVKPARSSVPLHLVCFQIARLRSELDVVRGNSKVMSEMLTEMVPGKEDPSDLELLQVRCTQIDVVPENINNMLLFIQTSQINLTFCVMKSLEDDLEQVKDDSNLLNLL